MGGDGGCVDGDDGTNATVEIHVLADVGEEGGGPGKIRVVVCRVSEEGGFFAFEGETSCGLHGPGFRSDGVAEETWC